MSHIHHASEVEESYSIQALRALKKFISSLGVLGDTLYRLRGSADMYIYSFFSESNGYTYSKPLG